MMAAPARGTRKSRTQRRLGFWVALAALVHVEAGLLVALLAYLYAPRDADLQAMQQPGGDRVEIGMVDDETARRILAELEQEAEKKKEEEAKKEEESKDSPGQVVEMPKPRNEERPDKARFAAEFNSTSAKETKKNGTPDKNAQLGASEGRDERTTQAQPESQPSPARQGAKGTETPKALAMREPSRPSPDRQQPGSPGPDPSSPSGQSPEKESGPPDGEGTMMPSGRMLLRPPGGGGGANPSPGSPSLMPTPQQMARAVSSGTDDYLKDIEDGDETSLNAKKWKHAAFFNRVKQQVRNHWRPAEVYRQHDPTFRIYGQRDRFTLLRIQLKPDGSLANVGLETPSGVDFLDDEAVEAFKQAQPFPNPPKQLVEQGSGVISFRFGFYFEIGGAPRMKIFRYDM